MMDRIFFGVMVWLLVVTLLSDAVTLADAGKAYSLMWFVDVALAGIVASKYLRKWRHWAK